jgi:hypothetical protein
MPISEKIFTTIYVIDSEVTAPTATSSFFVQLNGVVAGHRKYFQDR